MNPLFREAHEPIDFAVLTCADIQEAREQTLVRAQALRDQICAAPADDAQGRLAQRDALWSVIDQTLCPIYLMKDTHPDEALREVAGEAVEALFQFSSKLHLDEGLFVSLRDMQVEDDQLEPVLRRFRQKTMDAYLRNGFKLPAEQRKTLQELDEQLTQLELAFQKNISDGEVSLDFEEHELEGLPEDFKARHRLPEGGYRVSTQSPSYLPMLKFAKSDQARRRLYMAYLNRAADKNITILDKVLKLRLDKARLLGFESYADYHTSDTMAKTPQRVWQFLTELKELIKDKTRQDYNLLKEFAGLERVEPWSKAYISNNYKNQHLDLNEEVMKSYFPLQQVLQALFSLATRLFGVRIERTNLPVWESSVESYQMKEWDGEQVIARFYLDFFPRTGKYSHAACFPLQLGRALPNGAYQMPQSALVCNFTPPTDKPCLLTHEEVETLFHEFGHLFHGLLTRSPLSSFAGTSVVHDFVEMPSQMLENWAWERVSLREIGAHYETGEAIPEALIDKMLAAKHFNSGLDTQQQIFYAAFDFTLHHQYLRGDAPAAEDTTALLYRLQREYTLFEPLEGTHLQANFGHLMGYSAAYYGYLWSRVYAEDMFSVFRREGIFDAASGRRYRDEVLAMGDTVEAMSLIERFLGRPPEMKAFLESLGVGN